MGDGFKKWLLHPQPHVRNDKLEIYGVEVFAPDSMISICFL